MRTYEDSFSGQKIYPGKVRKLGLGMNEKKQTLSCETLIFARRIHLTNSDNLGQTNPRRIAWTVLFRRKHKKGVSEEVVKKRSRRTIKTQRAIVGASLDVIREKRTQRPEVRSAARAAAIKEGKDKRAAAVSAKKAEKAKLASASARGQTARLQSKQGAKGAPKKVQATTR
ncbi:hypothetical protein Golomagni_05546 [Golovinomyces magnicellulatus]|nr:hypothetical protein Golomagni_05546 [Golovinomyces magnicellulatus]